MKTILRLGVFLFSFETYCSTLATINGKDISVSEFRRALKSLGSHGSLVAKDLELRERFLDHLTEVELKSQVAMAQNLDKSEEFKQRLAQAKKQILASLLTERWMADHMSDESLRAYFETNHEMFYRQEVEVSHILLRDEADAFKVLGLVQKNPTSFPALVREYSISDAESQGRIGWIVKGSQPIHFEKAAFTTAKGNVYRDIIKTTSGYHIMRVDDVKYYQDKQYVSLKSDVKHARARDMQYQLSQDLKKQAIISTNRKALESYR
ncbi:MAG: peptidylprolyl isomerase [Oligoflexales bacterium]